MFTGYLNMIGPYRARGEEGGGSDPPMLSKKYLIMPIGRVNLLRLILAKVAIT